jgi:hypothetical protein
VTDRLIRMNTALAVIAVASVAAIISYQHAYELVRAHGESGLTARLLPFTVDGLIWAASMVVLDASRRNQRIPRLALWSLGAGIVATIGANLGHGLGHGPIGALVSAAKPMDHHPPAATPAKSTLEDSVVRCTRLVPASAPALASSTWTAARLGECSQFCVYRWLSRAVWAGS